jgi:hypothetical protein
MNDRETLVEHLNPGIVGKERLFPEKVRIQTPSTPKPSDVGSLAYSVRASGQRKGGWDQPIKVDEESLVISRRPYLNNLLDAMHSGRWTATTIKGEFQKHSTGIRLCDDSGYHDCLESAELASKAYFDISNALNDNLRKDYITLKTASQRQECLRIVFKMAFPEKYKVICRVANLIKKPRSDNESPTKSRVYFVRSQMLSTFQQLSEKVVSNAPYPWNTQFPSMTLHVFPHRIRPFITPFQQGHSRDFEMAPVAYDYENGLVRDYETTSKMMTTWKRQYAPSDYARFLNPIVEANQNKYHHCRWQMAKLAYGSYVHLFYLITGINPSPLQNIPWDSQYELVKDKFKNNFGSLKIRANGKQVTYPLGLRGITLFKDFLKLREYMLQGQSYDFLFFKRAQPNSKIIKLPLNFTTGYFNMMRGTLLPADMKNLTPRELRMFKNNDMHESGENSRVVADSLQHTQRTSDRIYSKGTEEGQANSLARYWSSFESVRIKFMDSKTEVVGGDLSANTDVSIASGHCDSFNNPEAVANEVPIIPRCNKAQGCLFCKKYACHADEDDVSKLYSLLYVITEFREQFFDYERGDKLFRLLSLRINSIMKKIREESSGAKAMVDKIEYDVMELGLLTPFWEMKLRRYESLGIIA